MQSSGGGSCRMSLQPGQTSEPPLTMEEMQFWLDKAVAWGQTQSAESQRDTCLHLSRLTAFVKQLLTHINRAVSCYRDGFLDMCVRLIFDF